MPEMHRIHYPTGRTQSLILSSAVLAAWIVLGSLMPQPSADATTNETTYWSGVTNIGSWRGSQSATGITGGANQLDATLFEAHIQTVNCQASCLADYAASGPYYAWLSHPPVSATRSSRCSAQDPYYHGDPVGLECTFTN